MEKPIKEICVHKPHMNAYFSQNISYTLHNVTALVCMVNNQIQCHKACRPIAIQLWNQNFLYRHHRIF